MILQSHTLSELSEALDVRSLTLVIKEQEAKMKKLEHDLSNIRDNQKLAKNVKWDEILLAKDMFVVVLTFWSLGYQLLIWNMKVVSLNQMDLHRNHHGCIAVCCFKRSFLIHWLIFIYHYTFQHSHWSVESEFWYSGNVAPYSSPKIKNHWSIVTNESYETHIFLIASDILKK